MSLEDTLIGIGLAMGLLIGLTIVIVFMAIIVQRKLDQYRKKYGWDNDIETKAIKQDYENRIRRLEQKDGN